MKKNSENHDASESPNPVQLGEAFPVRFAGFQKQRDEIRGDWAWMPSFNESPHNSNADARQVAQWMWEIINRDSVLDYSYAFCKIRRLYGSQFAFYWRRTRKISDDVLTAFKELHDGSVEWDKKNKAWLKR